MNRRIAALLVVMVLGLSGCPPDTPETEARPFLWGASTAAYQVEGGIDCSDELEPEREPVEQPPLPCNDYDYFMRSDFIHDTVANNSGLRGPAIDLEPAAQAVDFASPDVYRHDFDTAQALGLNAFRISIEWAKIEPVEDQFNQAEIDRYTEMIDEMRERGLEPIVTLNHFTLPDWVLRPPSGACPLLPEGMPIVAVCLPSASDPRHQNSMRGWETEETLNEWVEFVSHLVPQLRDKVDYWLTINEPTGSVVLGYVLGIWSPGFVFSGDKAKAVLRNLIEAHVRAYDVIKTCAEIDPVCDNVDADEDGTGSALVGFAHAMGPTTAAPAGFGGNEAANIRAASNFSYFLNDYFLNAVVFGREDRNYLDSANSDQGVDPIYHPEWEQHLDFLGINYYRRFHIYHDDGLAVLKAGFVGGATHDNQWGEPLEHEILNDLGWPIYPQGLSEIITHVDATWDVPVLITESGTPERVDALRAPHVVAHVREVQRALDDGADVLGYLYWSAMDNFEWHHGYSPAARFGLTRVPRDDPSRRMITEGALAYRDLIDQSRSRNGAGAPTPEAVDATAEKFGAISRDGTAVIPPARSPARFWKGTTAEGHTFVLYLTPVTGNVTGMIYRSDMERWRRVELRSDGGQLFLREHWHDDESGEGEHQDLFVSYDSGDWVGAFGGSADVRATRVSEAGTWQWQNGAPWGGDYFAVSRFEDGYSGKFLTYSEPTARDKPTPICGIVCMPDTSGPVWKPLDVEVGERLQLDATGREGENLFALSLQLDGSDTASTVAERSGRFTVAKAANILDAHFDLTGYLAPALDFTWSGERDQSPVSQFRFLETRGLFLERPKDPADVGGEAAQYYRENDPTSVLPLPKFSFRPTTLLGTRANISWEAGGRNYQIAGAIIQAGDFCTPVPCEGTWSDVAGYTALRLDEGFNPVASAGPDQTVRATGRAGATVQVDGGASFDFAGAPLQYRWSGEFGEATDPQATIVLPLGASDVCLEVTSASGLSSTDCLRVTVTRGPPR